MKRSYSIATASLFFSRFLSLHLFLKRLKKGIHVFVTGGIGGVHRGVEETMDVSADLTELGRTPVAVVRKSS